MLSNLISYSRSSLIRAPAGCFSTVPSTSVALVLMTLRVSSSINLAAPHNVGSSPSSGAKMITSRAVDMLARSQQYVRLTAEQTTRGVCKQRAQLAGHTRAPGPPAPRDHRAAAAHGMHIRHTIARTHAQLGTMHAAGHRPRSPSINSSAG
eukprot:COSAG01_NODE_334_length_18708_cov_49.649686_4_plen_151_part_00